MDEHRRWQQRRLLEQAAAALERNGFKTTLCETRAAAVAALLQEAAAATTVGCGGSVSLVELGVMERLEAAGKTVLFHNRPGLSPQERRQVMQQQLGCDLFLSGTNALTIQGQLVNVDASGNRVGAMAFGPGKVVVVAGANKLCLSLDGALRRLREVAAPTNARRLGFDTPCARTGICSDCQAPQRICRITTIIERCPRAVDLRVCLVNDSLGY